MLARDVASVQVFRRHRLSATYRGKRDPCIPFPACETQRRHHTGFLGPFAGALAFRVHHVSGGVVVQTKHSENRHRYERKHQREPAETE
jgi:hypothetical protein